MARTRDAEQTGAARRSQILAAAMTLFAENGYRGTSLAAVAAAAGITRSGVLHHFPSKEALLSAVLAERDQQAFDAVEVDRAFEGPAAVRALDILDGLAMRNEGNRELARLSHLALFGSADAPEVAHEWSDERIRTYRSNLARVIEQSVEAGDLRADVDAEATALLLVGAFTGLTELWLRDESLDMVAAVRMLTTLLRRDFAPNQD
ncbi:TetR/AcrR family transcriptional regulator [Rhodococcus maanshanensis]|uniref:DNA-binding transcriptional regulator, AcrR family n=1 Tax=Rhodococcus maanshanensis TaxID=183556 RepID=A0A1H7WR01_9NOCA|nr:TetR/AcrR family transcriptional regulator [Rhodococcus maanshanensis]SEM23942.1 DNA-binding transcriptional regulator, AcrR family [Rhodococcus maanshanensis]